MGPVHFVPWTFQLNFFSWVSLTCSDTEVQTCRNPSLSKFAYKQRKTTLQPWEDFSTEPPTKQTHKNNSMVSWGWWVKWSDDIFLLKLIPKHEVILFMCSFTFVSVWAVWSAVRSWWNLPSWLCMWSTSLYEWKSWRFIPPWMKKAPAKWGLAMPGPWMKSTWTGLTFLGGREFVRKTTLMMAEDVQECPNLQVFFLSMSNLPAYLFGFWVLSETAKRVLKNFALRVTWNNQPKVHPALFATRPLNSLPPPTAPKIAMKTCL